MSKDPFKLKGMKLSDLSGKIEQFIRLVRNSETEKKLTDEWKQIKKMYINRISRKNPYFPFITSITFIPCASIILEAKRKYFNGFDLPSEVETCVDDYLIQLFRVLNDLCIKAYYDYSLNTDQVAQILSTLMNTLAMDIHEREEEEQEDFSIPDNFFEVVKYSFKRWYDVYRDHPLKCLSEFSLPEDEGEVEELDDDLLQKYEEEYKDQQADRVYTLEVDADNWNKVKDNR